MNVSVCDVGRIAKKFEETAALSSRPITENIMPLSEALTKEKIASIKAKRKAQNRKQVTSGLDIMDDEMMQQSDKSGMDVTMAGEGVMAKKSSLISSAYDSFLSSVSMVSTADETDAIMREILQRESICRTRFTVLQSTGKQFEKDINAFLQLIKAKEDGSLGPNSSDLVNFGFMKRFEAERIEKKRI
jgi:hypothetical protein